ncbi:MAG: hypothetical protein GY847_26770 [Proteobacteria bacterium]|nr:hypothetical protein [Pseudomonadota bacterium]
MDRISLLTHRGKEILVLNYSELANGEYLKQIDKVENYIQSTTQKEILKLSILTDTVINDDVMDRIRSLNRKYKGLIEKEAVVGITGVKKVFLKAIFAVSSKDIKPFAEIDEAKDWLVE